jgi:hypothetical protein
LEHRRSRDDGCCGAIPLARPGAQSKVARTKQKCDHQSWGSGGQRLQKKIEARWAFMTNEFRVTLGIASSLMFAPAFAHHSYSMFDHSKTMTVNGTVAKLEWTNPHVFVWLYVKKNARPGEYDLYGFENGPITMLMRVGWTKDSFKAGEKVSVQYFPLRDGRPGGSFIKAVLENGNVMLGDTHAPGVGAEVDKAAAAAKSGAPR